MRLQKLFKVSSVGAQQEWEISTEGNSIVTRWGRVGGKIQETRDIIKEGKNQGRCNATTPTQQAEAEATSQWEQKLKKGYVKTLASADAGEVDDVIEGGINPMLAKRYDEQGDKITFPAYAQPKLDGHRCIAIVNEDGTCTLWSRTRKPITGLPHINEAVEALAYSLNMVGLKLDGELYNHAYKERFEELTSFIRNPTPKEGHEVVQYHIYDMPTEMEWWRRHEILKKFQLAEPLVLVDTATVIHEEDLMFYFERCLDDRYEGAMVRNSNGLYVGKRSLDLQKLKEFVDAEFEVVGVEEGRGKLMGKAMLVCKTDTGTFPVKLKGSQDELAKYWENPSLAIGRMLTVQYQGFTGTNKLPRFPVGLRFREDV